MLGSFLVGRAVFGGFFLRSGLNHFKNREMLRQYASAKGVVAPEAAVAASGALMAAGGFSLLTGVRPRQGLAAIVAALIPISLGMHRFWEVADPSERAAEETNFMKNMALVGASLMAMRIPEPWPASIKKLGPREDMYLHLGNRDRFRLMAASSGVTTNCSRSSFLASCSTHTPNRPQV